MPWRRTSWPAFFFFSAEKQVDELVEKKNIFFGQFLTIACRRRCAGIQQGCVCVCVYVFESELSDP